MANLNGTQTQNVQMSGKPPRLGHQQNVNPNQPLRGHGKPPQNVMPHTVQYGLHQAQTGVPPLQPIAQNIQIAQVGLGRPSFPQFQQQSNRGTSMSHRNSQNSTTQSQKRPLSNQPHHVPGILGKKKNFLRKSRHSFKSDRSSHGEGQNPAQAPQPVKKLEVQLVSGQNQPQPAQIDLAQIPTSYRGPKTGNLMASKPVFEETPKQIAEMKSGDPTRPKPSKQLEEVYQTTENQQIQDFLKQKYGLRNAKAHPQANPSQNQPKVRKSGHVVRSSIDKYLKRESSNNYSLENLIGQVEKKIRDSAKKPTNGPEEVEPLSQQDFRNFARKSPAQQPKLLMGKKKRASRVNSKRGSFAKVQSGQNGSKKHYKVQKNNFLDPGNEKKSETEFESKMRQLEELQKLNERNYSMYDEKPGETHQMNPQNVDRETFDSQTHEQSFVTNPIDQSPSQHQQITTKPHVQTRQKPSNRPSTKKRPIRQSKPKKRILRQPRGSSKSSQDTTVERLLRHGKEIQNEKAYLADQYRDQEMQDCTFQPQINKKRGKRSRKKRGFKRFMADMKKFEQRKQEKKQELRKQIMEKETDLTYRPKVCKKSKKLLKHRKAKKEPFHMRLHYNKRDQLQKQIQDMLEYDGVAGSQSGNQQLDASQMSVSRYEKSQFGLGDGKDEGSTFVPMIHSKSKNIVRDKKIDVILYEDALRRQQKQQKNTQKPKPQQKTHFSQNSEQAFAHKFIKDYEKIINEITFSGNSGRQKKLNYMIMCEIMDRMGFIKSAQKLDSPNFIQERTLMFDMWLVLKGDQFEGVTKRNLLVFLFAIVGLQFQIAKEEPEEDSIQPTSPQTDQNGSQTPLQQQFGETEKTQQRNFLSAENQRVFAAYVDNIRSKTKIGYFDEDNDFFLQDDDAEKIQKVYDLFYLNRLTNQKRKTKKKALKSVEHSHHPKTNKRSEKMAQKHRLKMLRQAEDSLTEEQREKILKKGGKVTHTDLLVYHKRAQEKKMKQKRKRIKKEKVQNCSFKPKTIDYGGQSGMLDRSQQSIGGGYGEEMIFGGGVGVKKPYSMPAKRLGKHRAFELYSLAKPRAQKKDRDPDEIEYEKFCDECTFAPDLTSTKNRNVYTGPTRVYAKNVNKAVNRLRKGRLMREQVAMWKERGYTNMGVITQDQLKEIDNFQTEQYEEGDSQYNDGEGYQEMDGQPQHQLDQEEMQDQGHEEILEDENQPLLFVDVNLGVGKQERIVVCDGDRADELAERFAAMHNLDEEMRGRLQQLLENQMATLLTRIDEETYSPSQNSEEDQGNGQFSQYGGGQIPPQTIQEVEEEGSEGEFDGQEGSPMEENDRYEDEEDGYSGEEGGYIENEDEM